MFVFERINAAQLHAPKTDNGEAVNDEETAFDEGAANRSQPDVMGDPAGG